MAYRELPPADLLRQCVDYDPETGVLTFKDRPPSSWPDLDEPAAQKRANQWNGQYGGKPAGSLCRAGLYVMIRGRCYFAHRIIWKWHYGTEPTGEIDHINGVTSDNRLANLRDVSASLNSRNRATTIRAKSGVRGVYMDGNVFCVGAHENGKYRYLGRYKTLEEAAAVRREYDIANGYTERHIAA